MSECMIVRRGGQTVEVNAQLKVFAPEGSHVTASCRGKTWQGDVSILNPHNLPVEYQEVEYLESTGTQYINTNLTVSGNVNGVKIDYQYTQYRQDVSDYGLFGAHDSGTDKRFSIMIYNDLQLACMGDGSHSVTMFNTINLNKHSVEMGIIAGNVVKVDGTTYNITVGNLPTTRPLMLFALNWTGTTRTASGRIYKCELYKDSTIVRNFIPCYRKSDNVAGMYDLVTNTFFTNSGTGTFILGPVLCSITFNVTKIGEYTVTATLDDKSKTTTVNIELPQEYVVELRYRLYLYKNGDECTDVTGGYNLQTQSSMSVVFSSDRITSSYLGGTAVGAEAYTKNLIDLTDYATLKALLYSTNQRYNNYNLAINIGFNPSSWGNVSQAMQSNLDSEEIISLDISAINGTYNVGLNCGGASGYCKEIWLE